MGDEYLQGRDVYPTMMEVTSKGRASIPVGLTKALDGLDQLNKVCLKSRRKKKNSMTGPG